MITEEHMKEGISRAYTIAVAHRAGLNYSKFEFDYGMDGSFSNVKIRGNRRVTGGYSIEFQLKSTENFEIDSKSNSIVYDLEVKNYNDLVEDDVGTPRILVLFTFPKDRNEWLNITKDATILKNCAWWCSLKGNNISGNKQKTTIRIPINQILTAEALQELMEKVKRGDPL
jgi:hypothetical protein